FISEVNVEIKGNVLPEKVALLFNDSRFSEINIEEENFSHVFENIQADQEFRFEAAGFRSQKYTIQVNDRPDLVSMFIRISEPVYTGGEQRIIENTGNIVIPEGSSVSWQIGTLATDSMNLFIDDEKKSVQRIDEYTFDATERIFNSSTYQIRLFNEFSQNKSLLDYSIDVVKDQYPEIVAEYFPDSITYQTLTLAGSISDDYGLRALQINYKKASEEKFHKIPLEINKEAGSQSFFANWSLDTISLEAGESMEVFLSVFDNDGVNGSKETRSTRYFLKMPTDSEIESILADKQNEVEDSLGGSKEKAKEIADRLEELEERLKSEQTFDWQEKKLLDNIIKDREELEKQVDELKKAHESLNKSNDKFQKQSDRIKEKNDQMQQLLNELMDEETRKLYEKLKELMKENASSDQVTQELNELKKNERNLERDLERAVELFKRLKMESALEQNLQKLDTLSKQQEEAAQQPDSKEQQEKINEQFEDFREKMNEVEQMNQELKKPEALQDFDLEERQIAKELREIKEQMEQQESQDGQKNSDQNKDQSQDSKESSGNQESGDQEKNDQQDNQPNDKSDRQKQSKSTQQKQKNAAKKMKSLSQKLSNMQGGMQMEMMQANLDQLRDILDNLVKLSFNQEEIMLEMREVNQSDPRFLELSQDQLKLKDDAKVIQDSLLSLASKVVQISSFITREVGSINDNINEAIEYLKDRNRGRALSSQQFAMTSINNLALLLDDTMQQMQMSMAESMGNSSSGEKQKPQGMPDLQELQNQLGEKINELKGSGKSGRELSEELARLAAEQEMIRQQMELLKESQDGKPGGIGGGDDLKKAIDMMEQNEVDLVNKRLTRQLINRQKQIMTRMLEAEKAQRNQETEEEREAEQSSVISREIPPGFEKYLELKKKEIELLKTIPIELNQFYKKEVNDYFRRLSSEDQND
ncbi:MAG: hypothetical protein AAFY41_01740, partial [Bacteroidota bacterium]